MSATDEVQKPVLAGKSAVVLGGIFLGLYAIFAIFGATDRAHRSTLELVDSPSAVGDPVVLTLPQPPALTTAPVVIRGGIPLFFVKYEGGHDDAMRKAGTDDTGKIPLYRCLKGDDTFKEGTYAKLAPGLYAVLGEKK